MSYPWIERCRTDLSRLDPGRAGLAFLDACAAWLADRAWSADAAKVSDRARRQVLVELAHWAHAEDVGGYASLVAELAAAAGLVNAGDDASRFASRHLAHQFMALADDLAFRDPESATEALAGVSLVGVEHVDAALAAGRGVMTLAVAQAHPAFAFRHPRFADIGVSAVGNDALDVEGRQSPLLASLADRVEILPVSPAAMRRLLSRLRSGGVVAIYADFRFAQSQGVPVPLLGGPVLLVRAAVSVALKTGAVVLPVTAVRREPLDAGPVELRFFPALPLADLETVEYAVERAALRFAVATEALVRYEPAAWRLWGTLPYRWAEAERAVLA